MPTNQLKNKSVVAGMPTPATTRSAITFTTFAIVLVSMPLIEETSTPSDFLCRKFLCSFELSSPASLPLSPSAFSSLFCEPSPSHPPLSSDPIAAYSINHNPSLFCVTSPIHVAWCSALLKNHPNCAFVSFVLLGLVHGFLHMASLPYNPIIHHPNHPSCVHHIDAITNFCDKEVLALCFSNPFSTLLPGMKVTPLCVSSRKGLPNLVCVMTCALARHLLMIS